MHTQNLTEDQRAQVKFIEEVVREGDANRAAADSSTANQHEEAAVTCSLTSGPDGANLEGWITYNKPKLPLYFKSSEITKQEGLPIAIGAAFPVLLVLRREKLANKTGTFVATGWGPNGTLQIKVDGVAVFWLPVLLTGLGLFSWRVEGKVAFGE